jgi:hypothetical protein
MVFKNPLRLSVAVWILLVLIGACKTKKQDTMFVKLDADQTGISFRNDIHDNDSSKSFINEFGYMGGGVGIGDFNNDGLKDIVFTANQESSRLYINKGSNQFEDITGKAGLHTDVWATGVSIVDINHDGFDDIYICTFGKNLLRRSPNLLFINQQDLTFKEEAGKYGLADSGYSSQAAFFDYDRDGDLDMFLANYSFGFSNTSANNIVPRDHSGNSVANDRLYRNDGDSAQQGHPVFTDVSMQAGIREDGYGLGVVISDFNDDGWPDVYVADDFLSNDYLWLNNKNGTFTNTIARSLRHQSYSSMGVDAGDLNNDGLSDVVTLDMLPESNERKKTSVFFMNYERYQTERIRGYEPEFMRNMLQLNNGNRMRGDTAIPFFSEIGQMAGIAATDWSWSVLLADFNNDGWKDMHVTNGIGRDFINADFVEFSNQVLSVTGDKREQQSKVRQRLASLDHVNLPNYLYANNKGYTFNDISAEAGINELSMSNGAAYADIDNDGDLDIVVNNINKEAFIFENKTITGEAPAQTHYLKIRLRGTAKNRQGFGAKICLYRKEEVQVNEQNPARGYFSSVDQDIHFGLGGGADIDSLVITWPDGNKETAIHPVIDTTLVLDWKNACGVQQAAAETEDFLFTDITPALVDYRHREYEFNDFAYQRLLPQKFSQLGPFITTGDFNGDGLADFFVGGANYSSGKVFTQAANGFANAKIFADSLRSVDDADCLLFDADGDKDLDLIVTVGDVQGRDGSDAYRPRLYINDGRGQFTLRSEAIPVQVKTIAGTVSVGDYDGDGDDDLFIGGRASFRYPTIPRSFLLRNDGGVFTEVTKDINESLAFPGMITSSAWADIDDDNKADLIIAGEWMSIRVFRNANGRLVEVTGAAGLENEKGMWRSMTVADIDKDGDMDIIAGNLGLNCLYQTAPGTPMELYAKDLDGNGSIDPILFYHIRNSEGNKKSYPAISRGQFSDQVPAVKKQFLQAKEYAKAGFNEIFKGRQRDSLQHLTCTETRSCYFENVGNGKFQKHVLPMEVQFAPVNAIICEDIDNDGWPDLIMAGNEYQADVITGRYDASYGCFLKGGPGRQFHFMPPVKSGFVVDGDVKDMAIVAMGKEQKLLLVGVNNDALRVFRIR